MNVDPTNLLCQIEIPVSDMEKAIVFFIPSYSVGNEYPSIFISMSFLRYPKSVTLGSV